MAITKKTLEPDMPVDWLILIAAAVCGGYSLPGLIVFLWWASSMGLTYLYEFVRLWWALLAWVIIMFAKDFALMVVSGRNGLPRLVTIGLMSTCLFHQVLSWQIKTYNWENVTLFDYRSDFMLYLSVIMLATVITDMIGGGTNGGRRVVNRSVRLNFGFFSVLHLASQKVIK